MKVIVDSCSIILLTKASILKELTQWKKVKISKGVYNEVLEGKEKKLFGALLLEKLVEDKNITIEDKINLDLLNKLTNDFGLGLGEAESIVLALESEDKIIITDNKQGRKAAKIYGLELVGSIGIVVSLFKAKIIDKEKALNSLNTLKKEGWVQDYLIEKALEDIQNG